MEWSGPAKYMVSIQKCTFCNKPIVKTAEESNFQSVLHDIAVATDTKALLDGKLLVAMFSDFAPSLVREKRLLRAFVECGGNSEIYHEITNCRDPQKAVERTVKQLSQDFSLAEEAAREVCQAFMYAALDNSTALPAEKVLVIKQLY